MSKNEKLTWFVEYTKGNEGEGGSLNVFNSTQTDRSLATKDGDNCRHPRENRKVMFDFAHLSSCQRPVDFRNLARSGRLVWAAKNAQRWPAPLPMTRVSTVQKGDRF